MALARVLEIIALLIYVQESRGQYNNLINTNPTLGQNNLNQSFQNTANIKSVTDNLLQKENLGKNANIISQNQVNSQHSSIPQTPCPQSQNFPQILNQQLPQNSQQPLLYQPQVSFIQQPSIVQQQPYNSLESPSTFIPVNNAGNINYHQQGTPSIQQVPVQVSQSVPISNSYVPTYPSTSPLPSYGGQRIDLIANLGGNYLVPISAFPYSVPEGQIVNSLPTLPYTTILPTPNPTTLENDVVMPYQNFGIFENLLDNFSQTATGNDVTSTETDKLTNLLMSLLQSPKKLNYLQAGNSYSPYTPYKLNQETKSSSLKLLLPIILNLIKERREGCSCNSGCNCNRRNRNKKNSEIQNNERLDTKKRDYSLKEEMFCHEESDEDIPRTTREHKKDIKVKNTIPDISIESNESDSMDYDHLSEEEED